MKEIMAFLFLFLFIVKANSQPQIEEYNGYSQLHRANELMVISDTKQPFHDGMCRKLVPELTYGKNGTWSRYRFIDAPLKDQWYKDFAFFKIMTPNSNYNYDQHAIFDVVNNMYWHYIENVDDIIYIHMVRGVPDPSKNYYCFNYDEGFPNLEYESDYYKETYLLSNLKMGDKQYCTFLDKRYPDRTPVYYYKFSNADYINEKIPDNDVNTKANYLFLQRDYKLGNIYNTVIFPVDVPIKDYNHLYNNGKNRLIVYRLDAIDTDCLHFVRDISGVLKANTPYIIKGQKNDGSSSKDIVSEYYLTEKYVENFDINCKKKVMSSNNVDVYAQYKQYIIQYNEYISPDEDIFIVSNNKLINCRNIKEATVNRFRWYIKRPASQSATPMTMTFDGTTDIDVCEDDSKKSNEGVYDLNGCKLGNKEEMNNLQKGYYIVDGKVRYISD